MNNKPTNGFECPACRSMIKFTIADLLNKKSITCPGCMLTMDMNVPPQMAEHLNAISEAEKSVEDPKNFSR